LIDLTLLDENDSVRVETIKLNLTYLVNQHFATIHVEIHHISLDTHFKY